MRQLLKRFWSDESGQGMVEYALIVALVAIGLIAVFLYLRNSTGKVLDTAADSLSTQPTNGYVPTTQ
jgi:pilus assembly protein Flp/PilA